MRFDGRIAAVTGAARGIGAGIAARLVAEGVQVVIADIDGDQIGAALEELESVAAGMAVAVAADLSCREGARRLVDTARSSFGGLDILVNNAGGGVIRPTLEHSEETLRATIDRNLWTTIYCSLEVLPGMVERGYGRIVNLGAESVRNGLEAHAVYNAAKGGVHGFTTGLAREFAGCGITVNTVAPSWVETVPYGSVTNREVRGYLDRIRATIPAGRPATVEEVASMVAYVASDEAGFVTGQVISVNGGSSML